MKPDPTHADKLQWLAGLTECRHTDAQWIPDDPNRAGCEDGRWRCLLCGAERRSAYRPLLEHWEGGTGLLALLQEAHDKLDDTQSIFLKQDWGCRWCKAEGYDGSGQKHTPNCILVRLRLALQRG